MAFIGSGTSPRLLGLVAGVVVGLLLPLGVAAPAQAQARVDVRNEAGEAAADPTYLTRLSLRGTGFQSVARGHGGIYVQFGAVRGNWRPSQGGVAGQNYFSVPDSETKNNAGYLKYVAFPGSDTADAANGGTLAANGTWATTINVPGATFQAHDRAGKVTTIDCRKDTCGIITFGAHGVINANNETFTPVKMKDLYTDASEAPAPNPDAPDPADTAIDADGAAADTSPAAEDRPEQTATGKRKGKGKGAQAAADPATLEVDRASAHPGRVLAFTATGLRPGSQVSATFDDGRAGVGPLTVGANGQLAGLLQLPTDLATGTYELRLVGEGELPTVRFAVVADSAASSEPDSDQDWVQIGFVGVAALLLLAAIGFTFNRRRRARVAE